MPTPVATAKQCLTPEASQALDEAVSIARAKSHAQTTSLHAVSALLSLPGSGLREACFRARTAAFCYYSSPRAQIRAMEFALSLSLDRSPVLQQRVESPPVSNSLMAAIKRSQANQRRQPDGFGFRQEQGKEQQFGSSGIKVEIQNLIVAILDDPIVSRVFNEAGFSSFDLKLAMARPLQGFWRYNSSFSLRQRLHRSRSPFRFPFSEESCGDEDFSDFRRIGEVLVRKKGRNPLLFGVCAYDALHGFVEAVKIQDLFLPLEIRGVKIVSVESEISKLLSEDSGEEIMNSRFEEFTAMVEGCCGPGLIICFGDLKAFIKDDDDDDDEQSGFNLLSKLISKFTKFLELYRDQTWLIGCATYEIYLKFLTKFPAVEKDWDLQPFAITSMKASKSDMNFKSSLMGSFVPFAGFFPSSPDLRGTPRSSYQLPIRGNVCSDRNAQDVSTGPGYSSVADRCQASLPSWLRLDKFSETHQSDTLKGKDDFLLLRPLVDAKASAKEEKELIMNKESNGKASVGTDLALGMSSVDDTNNFKSLFEALIRRIQCQEDAVRIISQTISQTRASKGNLKGSTIRGDVWMNFIGSDEFSMRKTALALSEVVCGTKGSLSYFDPNSQDGLMQKFTRKTMVDDIADNLRKNPSSVVFLDNLHLTHPPAQNSLLHAIRTGKFMDSHGREIGTGNSIFLLRWDDNRRKRHCLDLNVPANELCSGTHDAEMSEFESCTWLEELSGQVDATVFFKA